MTRRRLRPKIRAALMEVESATLRRKELSILNARCPICDAPLSQSMSGEKHLLYHFDCRECGAWAIIGAAGIREAILGSADPDDGDDTVHGSGFLYLWFNAETGRLVPCPTDDAYRRRKEFLARKAAAVLA